MFNFKNRRSILLFGLVVLLTNKKTYYTLGGIAAIWYFGYASGGGCSPSNSQSQNVSFKDVNGDGLEDMIVKENCRAVVYFKQKDGTYKLDDQQKDN